jgi:hypothetical protein
MNLKLLMMVAKISTSIMYRLPNEDVTSKFSRKLAIEFQMNDSVGRESTMDPFANKDITKILGKPQRDRLSLLHNVNKPVRHSPSPVDIKHGDDRSKSGFPQITSITPGPEYNIPTTLSDAAKSIPLAVRWAHERPQTVQESKRDAMKSLRTTQLSESLHVTEPPASFTSWDATAPKLAAGTGRGELFGPSTSGAAPHSPPIHMPKTADRFTVFHWEQKKRLERQAVELTAGNDTSRTKPPPPSENRTETSNHEDKWANEHKSLLSRMGINGTARADATLRRQKAVPGPNFSSMPGRNAPSSFHYKYEVADVSYDPKVPLRTGSAAVSFKKSSGRAVSAKPYIETANRCLEYTSLAKFHERQKIRARTSPFALPDQSNDPSADDELRVYDDLAMHPESLRQPSLVSSKKFKNTPDIALFSDRADAPLQHVLGANAKKYLTKSMAGEDGTREKKKKLENEGGAEL